MQVGNESSELQLVWLQATKNDIAGTAALLRHVR